MGIEVTPWNPSKSATKKVLNTLDAPSRCVFCSSPVAIQTNEVIYGRPYGKWPWIYHCTAPDCGAYVGMHPFTNIPLGTLADRPTREARKRAKSLFNPLWENGEYTRSECYQALAKAMGIPVAVCHFGWFTVQDCEKAIEALNNGIF